MRKNFAAQIGVRLSHSAKGHSSFTAPNPKVSNKLKDSNPVRSSEVNKKYNKSVKHKGDCRYSYYSSHSIFHD